MELITIKADNIDGAAEEIIGFLQGRGKGRDVIYLDGLHGLGASAVLKAIVKRLRSSFSGGAATATTMTAGFDNIIHLDCSLWQSKRALQKVIAEELKLPQHVMAIFDQHDEEDDFYGVEQGARGVIPDVRAAIFNDLNNRRFLVVFHNGSGGYIDLMECGVPVIGSLGKRVLWTSQGRFRLHAFEEEVVKKLAGLSDAAIYIFPPADEWKECFRSLLHAEADEVARYTGVPYPDMRPEIVIESILYRVLMRGYEYGIDWGTSAPNYLVCDGIIQTVTDGGRSTWEVSDHLHRNMHMDLDEYWEKIIYRISEHWVEQWRCSDRWVSGNRLINAGVQQVQVPPQATSFFLKEAGLEAGMFGHSDGSRLRVIHLSKCAFSFSSPPFLSCINLRFLHLDHCKDKDAIDSGEEEVVHHSHICHGGRACFQKIWVLDVSYTDWYWLLSVEMMDLMVELRELNVMGVKNWSISHLCHGNDARSNSRRLLNLCKLRVTAEPAHISSDKNPASSRWSPLMIVLSWSISPSGDAAN